MEKTYSQIIGIPVAVEGLGKIARITDLVVDTQTGKITCFFVNAGKMKIILPSDILFFGQAIMIGDSEDIIDAEDIVRVTNVLERDIRLLKAKVQTQKGESLGHVHNLIIDIKFFGLTKIVVYKSFFGLFKTQDLLISARDIVKIEKDLITVKSKCAKQLYRESEKDKVTSFYPDLAS
jgi:sporulation protein YlmC with PRC-barrel domain